MTIESILHSLTDRFRVSKSGFEVYSPPNPRTNVLLNPQVNINPFGDIAKEVTIFVFGDTHYHFPERGSYDRTATLPTTHLAKIVRRKDWHRQIRPNLYNTALMSWSAVIASFLQRKVVQPTDKVILIHAGDIGDDALNQTELATAFETTHHMVREVQNQFRTTWGSTVSFIQALGDHDADVRSWTKERRTKQVQWLYHLLDLEKNPACYLQEIQGQKTKALLVLDTNLLEEEWQREIEGTAQSAIQRIHQSIGILPQNAEDLHSLAESSQNDPQLLALCKDALLGYVIAQHTQRQEAIIQEARKFEDVVIVGHKPNIALKIASSFDGEATVISGHWHFAYNSEQTHFLRLPTRFTQGGKPIKLLIVAPPTRGLVGIEYASEAVAYMLRLGSDGSIVHTLTQ